MLRVYISLVLVIQLFYTVNPYRILCTYPTISRSHFIVVEGLMIGLAEIGHDVTVVSPFPPGRKIKNYRHITTVMNKTQSLLMDKFTESPGSRINHFKVVPFMIEFAIGEIRNMLKFERFTEIMANEKFDLVVVEAFHGDVLFGLGAHFDCPVVRFTSFKIFNYFLEQLGNPREISYVPNVTADYQAPMKFIHRILNMLIFLIERPLTWYKHEQNKQHYSELFPPPKYPPFSALENNSSAIFVSKHFSEGNVLPLLPGVIEIGGVYLKQTQNPLPSTLQKWMDDSSNGVIYFSFGTNIKCSKLGRHKYQSIVNAFKRLKENILWKCESDDLSGVPSNVLTANWLPQIDILQHKNLKLFVTHAGLGSITEGRFYGVPLVVIPFFADQMTNAEQVQNERWAKRLEFIDLNANTLYCAIREVIDDPQYRNEAKYRSILYRDRPLTALQTAIFWIEYIIRHKGAPHLQSNALQLNFFQLHSLDVIGFLCVAIVIILYINYRLLKWGAKKLFFILIKTKFE